MNMMNMMDYLETIGEVMKGMPNLRKMDIRKLPCKLCQQSDKVCYEMQCLNNLNNDNSHFYQELVATYHAMLHSDKNTCKKILHYKDPRSIIGVYILADTLHDKNKDHGVTIRDIADEILMKRYVYRLSLLTGCRTQRERLRSWTSCGFGFCRGLMVCCG